ATDTLALISCLIEATVIGVAAVALAAATVALAVAEDLLGGILF
ncbi:hypothetical protein Tco_0280122, partial [Tanacetum coccineum]